MRVQERAQEVQKQQESAQQARRPGRSACRGERVLASPPLVKSVDPFLPSLGRAFEANQAKYSQQRGKYS